MSGSSAKSADSRRSRAGHAALSTWNGSGRADEHLRVLAGEVGRRVLLLHHGGEVRLDAGQPLDGLAVGAVGGQPGGDVDARRRVGERNRGPAEPGRAAPARRESRGCCRASSRRCGRPRRAFASGCRCRPPWRRTKPTAAIDRTLVDRVSHEVGRHRLLLEDGDVSIPTRSGGCRAGRPDVAAGGWGAPRWDAAPSGTRPTRARTTHKRRRRRVMGGILLESEL